MQPFSVYIYICRHSYLRIHIYSCVYLYVCIFLFIYLFVRMHSSSYHWFTHEPMPPGTSAVLDSRELSTAHLGELQDSVCLGRLRTPNPTPSPEECAAFFSPFLRIHMLRSSRALWSFELKLGLNSVPFAAAALLVFRGLLWLSYISALLLRQDVGRMGGWGMVWSRSNELVEPQ